MNPLALVLFAFFVIAGLILGLLAMSAATSVVIGYRQGATLAVLTQGHIRAYRRHRWLLAGVLLSTVTWSLLGHAVLPVMVWTFSVFPCTIGMVPGELLAYWTSRHDVLPVGGKNPSPPPPPTLLQK